MLIIICNVSDCHFVSHEFGTLLYFPLALTAPSHVSAQEVSADSIKVSWTPAPTASSVSVTYYINASSSTYQTVRRTVTDPDRQVVISGLHPFAEYHITVQAGNPGGLSEPTGRSATTTTAGVYCYCCNQVVIICLYVPLNTFKFKILAHVILDHLFIPGSGVEMLCTIANCWLYFGLV